jgi:glycosyltransferase involved in cell wall biosynthesis
MYESIKDQIKYERREGLKSEIVNGFQENPPEDQKDEFLSPIPWSEAEKANVWVMHSLIPEKLKHLFSKKVMIAVLHGPTEHMLLKEWTTQRTEMAFNLHISILWQYDATVVLNKHEYDIMKLYDEHDKLHYIPNSIDLERYIESPLKWQYEHHPAIISCDVNRLEKLPAHILWAMPKIIEKVPTARLNLFSLDLDYMTTWRNIFCRAKKRRLDSVSENIQLAVSDLRPFMAGADIGFNNNMSGILSRTSMELMAMGVPVVSYGGNQAGVPYTKYVAKIWDLDSIAEQIAKCWHDLSKKGSRLRKDTMDFARRHFSRAKHVKKYIELYQNLEKIKYGRS